MEGTQFLKDRYNLHATPEVGQAANRTRIRTHEKVPQDPNSQIQNYLDRLANVFNPPALEGHPDFDRQGRNLDMLKPIILDRFVTKFDDIPESYWKGQERILRERGQQGDYDRFSEEEKNKWKRELTEGLLSDQRASLEQWIDYFATPNLVTSSEEAVPLYVRYWMFRSVIGLQEYDKEKGEFPERSRGTVKMFPDINQEALAYVMDALLKKHKDLPLSFDMFDAYLPEEQKEKLKEEFKKGLEKENFAKLYAWANEQIRPIPEHLMPVTDGKWIKYSKSSDHKPLVASIRGRGTGWCTAGESFAISQLKAGDFYVFYSNDDSGNAVNPRIAIRMVGDRIEEVRGIAAKQNLDPFMGDVLEAKLDEFPDKDKYLKKEADMKRLTEIDNKAKRGEDLDRDDLIFLYELNSPIEGFGYENNGRSSDPRIKELRSTRNPEDDMPTVFDCEPFQIAHSTREINEHTKAYVGKLETGIFDLVRKYKLEHIYTSFPEGRIRFDSVTVGGKDLNQLQRELSENKINVSSYAEYMMRTGLSLTKGVGQNLDIVRLKVGDLGLPDDYPTTDKIFKRAEELGLELCPADLGPNYRLQYKDQPMNEWFSIGMKPISDSRGYPRVFRLVHYASGLWLDDSWARPDDGWGPRRGFVFSLSKFKS